MHLPPESLSGLFLLLLREGSAIPLVRGELEAGILHPQRNEYIAFTVYIQRNPRDPGDQLTQDYEIDIAV
jgi:hypothetical protein